MSRTWHSFFLGILLISVGPSVLAQTNASLDPPIPLIRPSVETSSTPTAQPRSLTFTASTDQRFFFFNDTRNENNRRMPVVIYGIRTGFLFPPRRYRPTIEGGRPGSFRAGVGFYFVNQKLNRPGLLPNTSASVVRRLRIATLFYERYLYRRPYFDVSMPLELGYGHSRYELNDDQSNKHEVARGVFVPAGAGLTATYQFPSLCWFRPLHWFGFSVLTGYRFIVKKDVPRSNVNYNGLYGSAGLSFFLDNFSTDLKSWRFRRKSRRRLKQSF